MGVSLALMATTLSSCDLDTTPTTSLDSDAAFKTTTYAENVLRGAWSYAFNEWAQTVLRLRAMVTVNATI